MNGYKVVMVNYLNTKPFLEGLKRSTILEKIDLEIAHPAECAEKLINQNSEIGLIPVASLLNLNQYELLSNYCLGCDGPVSTVCVFSERPLRDCKTLILDYQSRSSAAMVRYFQNNFWKYDGLEIVEGSEGYEHDIRDYTAGLVIGDRCFSMHTKYKHILDLGDEWKRQTGLPFTFAVWISRIPLSQEFQNEFNQALQNGVQNLQWSANPGSAEYRYLKSSISYPFDQNKRKAFSLFLGFLEQELVPAN